jgi:hypothetical protein
VTDDLLWPNSLDLVGFTITAYLQTYPAAHDRPPSTSCHCSRAVNSLSPSRNYL